MSLMVHPRHGMVTEMILKEQAWTAKFIRQQKADKKAEMKKAHHDDRSQRRAEDTILRFVGKVGPRAGTPMSNRSLSAGSLSLAGAMAMDDGRRGSTPPSVSPYC